jgi:hypothetical protein
MLKVAFSMFNFHFYVVLGSAPCTRSSRRLHKSFCRLNREVHRLHNYNQIQNKEDTTVSTFVLLLFKTQHVLTSYRVIIRRTILS